MKIAVCSIGSPCLLVFKASVEAYAKEHDIVLSGPGGQYTNIGKNFGEAYNELLFKIFETETECLVANDDIVLDPNTINILLQDVEQLKISEPKLGWIGARSNRVSGDQGLLAFRKDIGAKQTGFIAPIFAWVSREAFLAAPFAKTHWYSDNLSCSEMHRLGYKMFVSRAYVHHVGSASGKPKGEPGDLKAEAGKWMWLHHPEYAKKWKLSMPDTLNKIWGVDNRMANDV